MRTLVALVVWLGAMIDAAVRRPDPAALTLILYGCGAATVVGLFVLKFIGPPPHAFVLRAGIAVLMLAIAAAAAFDAARRLSTC